MKIAFVYDRVNKWGGAERVLLALHKIWPQAPLYTSVHNSKTAPWAKVFDVRTSFIQNLPVPKNAHENYPFLMGIAFESFDFSEFDVVISITSEFAKSIRTLPKTIHVCYCLTPTGYLWSGYEQYFSGKGELFRKLTKPLINYLRWYDLIVAQRPDYFLGISEAVRQRIQQYYSRDSKIIYPPVSISSRPKNSKSNNYFLIVSRLVPNKKLEFAIEAFNKLGWQLKIVGEGKDFKRLKSLAKPNVEFLGSLTQPDLESYYEHCQCLIVPAEEDFGIVSVEAQSFGKPVVAFAGGGALETVIENKTGWYFEQRSAKSLYNVLKSINIDDINPEDCRENAKRFSEDKFCREIKKYIDKLLI